MEPPCEGECWNISELLTSLHKLKLFGWIGRCMHLNIYDTLTLCSARGNAQGEETIFHTYPLIVFALFLIF